MPILAGMVARCQQRIASPPGHTHSGRNCLYALDLSNCAEEVIKIVAAASGRVAFVYRESPAVDSNAGLRFGNQVNVDHGGGYCTFYSHLEKVIVREGDVLRTDEPLGSMGNTGAAAPEREFAREHLRQ
jgi:murein DD-endopeptidase MepM/ murein hydrolase activator NlpD